MNHKNEIKAEPATATNPSWLHAFSSLGKSGFTIVIPALRLFCDFLCFCSSNKIAARPKPARNRQSFSNSQCLQLVRL